MARGPKSYLWQPVISSPVIQQKGWRAKDSCFALIGARQCGVLMDNVETTSVSLVVNTKTASRPALSNFVDLVSWCNIQ